MINCYVLDDKVRDHCHITGKYRGGAHLSCNINLKLCKKIPDNLRGYDSHLIIKEISKFDVKISVIPNALEKYMAFTINLLTDYLSDHDFKYLSEEFSGEFLRLVKQKGVYPYEYMNS